MDLIATLEMQLERNTEAMANTPPEQHSARTPCPEFDARALMNHMVGANYFFASVAEGQRLEDDGSGSPDLLGDDAAAAHHASATQLVSMLRRPGVLDRTFDFGFAQIPGQAALGLMVMETTIHGWDLAKATGQDATIDPALAEMLIAGAKALDSVRNEQGNPFGFVVDVPDSAPPGDRLIALSGRQP
jgi:uncharacterized protein (TIGR03086 family)